MTPANPYVGLQFFDEATAHLFFGRDDYVDDLVEKLEQTRFLAVLGHSGSGKSSLVRAGLIPALRAQGGRWLVAKFRPETTPISCLGKALDQELEQTESEADLRRGPLGIFESFERHLNRDGQGADGDTNLLVLADQFEELFRLEEETAGQPGSREEAAAFVQLLLQATRHPHIYVVLTMRSDYLKDCARYRDLPERINRSMYLVPRMKRDELELAILGPARGSGIPLDPPLVQRLLNDAAGPDLDHLPLIEHLLARIWENGAARGRLTIDDYEAVGGWAKCLSHHADKLYEGLTEPEQHTCELIFRRLTLRDEANRDVRSRAKLSELFLWCGGRAVEVRTVVNRFRDPAEAFLTPVGKGDLPLDASLDIAHESLIRNWTKLTGTDAGWTQREAEAREAFRGLEWRSRRGAGQRGELKGGELAEAVNLLASTWSQAWVSRYFPPEALERVMRFAHESVEAIRKAEEEESRRANELLDAQSKQLSAAIEAAEAKENQLVTARRGRTRLLWVMGVLAVTVAGLIYFALLWREERQNVDALRKTGAGSQLETIAELRNQIADLSKSQAGRIKINPADGLRYVYAPPGEFQMGCSPDDKECDDQDETSHSVQITKGFWIGQTEATQAAYEKIKKANPSRFKGSDRPVEQVSWNDADGYCKTVGLRLPTEAEWEYAARAGNKQSRYGPIDAVAWYSQNSQASTQPAATKQPNSWGLYDTLGNVWEWTNDWYDPGYYKKSPRMDPQGPDQGDGKVVRGGSWYGNPQNVRVSDRNRNEPSYRSYIIGFRCAGELR